MVTGELHDHNAVLPVDKYELHRKFHDLARQSYPDVGEPGAVWVLAEVLHWPMDVIKRVSVDGFGKQSYRLFVLDGDGKRVLSDEEDPTKRHVKTVTRKWTKAEKALLKDWWWLLGF